MVKKIFAFFIALSMTFALSACAKPCNTCNKTGRIACECQKYICSDCDGDGDIMCSTCKGLGYDIDICSICDGKGYIVNPITWQTFDCDITEKIDCPDCVSGDRDCRDCGGDGLVRYECDNFHSWVDGNYDRTIDCPDCEDGIVKD